MQTTETLSVRFEQACSEMTCGRCGSASLLTPEAVAAAFGLSLRAIYRAVEAGRLHFRDIGAGRVLICPDSLHSLVRSVGAELRQDSVRDRQTSSAFPARPRHLCDNFFRCAMKERYRRPRAEAERSPRVPIASKSLSQGIR